MSFDVLNDDCCLAIIIYLETKDQISLYEATKGISRRVNSCVIQNWKFEQCFYIDETSIEKFLAMPEMLNIFLSIVSRNMIEFKLDHVRLEFLKRCLDFKFPNMKTLHYKLCVPHLEDQSAAADECLKLMIELFPRLHSLKAHSGLNFNLLQHFTQLRKLELTPSLLECEGKYNIDKSQLLEEVTVHYDWHWFYVVSSIGSLPKLHTVFFYIYKEFDIFHLIDYILYKSIKIHFNNGIRQYEIDSVINLIEIRSLIYPNIYVNIENRLPTILKALKQLLKLDLMDLKIVSNAEMRAIQNIDPSLILHHVSDIHLEKEFFKAGDKRFMEESPFTLVSHKKSNNELAIGLKVQVSSMSIRIPERIN